MAAFEGSYASLLQGVSQQVPRDRKVGQLQAQENMLSDAVTGLRRRPAAQFAYADNGGGATTDNTRYWFTDIGGQQVHVSVNSTSGNVTVRDLNYNVLNILSSGGYLIASQRKSIRGATVGDEFFLANTEQLPISHGLASPVVTQGFFYVRSGGFGKQYRIYLSTSTGTQVLTYLTPDGTTAGDAALSTPEYIAAQLAGQVTLGVSLNVAVAGAYVGLTAFPGATGVTVTSDSGSSYIVGSNQAYLKLDSDLPAILPAVMSNFIVATGSPTQPVYYTYSVTEQAWLESGIQGSVTAITNVPVSIMWNGTAFVLNNTQFEGRLAGDDETNANPAFLTRGVTGMGAFQGRLVLLAGSYVCMSASNKPRRFYRTTVTGLLDSDTIGIASSANSSASYEYCVPFQKDLLLFSEKYQALVPSGNVAITPRTATVVVTSTYQADMSTSPITTGRTLMYAAPRSADFFGIMEMLPSQYTDSQYVSSDSTEHIPKYMAARCRFMVSSSVAGLVLFGSTTAKNVLVVHEYIWSGDNKAQSSWHRWTFEYDICDAYFSGNVINLVFVRDGNLMGCTIDPRLGGVNFDATRRPFLDFYQTVTVTDHVVNTPAALLAQDPDVANKVALSVSSGDLAGDAVGFTVTDASHLETVRSYPSGSLTIGVPYTSSVVPTPPMVKDQNNVVITSNKLTVLRFMASTVNSSEYKVAVHDSSYSDPNDDIPVATLLWSNSELELGESRFSADSTSIIPCRTNAARTTLALYTEGAGELNLVGLEYVCRYTQKLRRR